MRRILISLLLLFGMLLLAPVAIADPPNYGITHYYVVPLSTDFVTEVAEEIEIGIQPRVINVLSKASAAGIAYYYYERERIARKKDGKLSIDSDLDKWLPVLSLSIELFAPELHDWGFNRIYTKPASHYEKDMHHVYFTILEF